MLLIDRRTAPARFALALSLALCAASSCAAPQPPRTIPGSAATPLHNAVMARVSEYYETLSARDWERLPEHFWPNARLATIWQAEGQERPQVNAVSIEEFVARAPEGPGSQPIFEERLLAAEVRALGTLAAVWAHYEARFGSEEQLAEWRGIDAITLLHHDGEWRIISIAYASDR